MPDAHRPKTFWPEFQADDEQQQHHAELGRVHHRLDLVEAVDHAEAGGTDGNTGGEIAENRAQTKTFGQGCGDRGSGQENGSVD